MVTIDINYTGELHCIATHTPSGVTLQTDAPVDNKGRGESFSPTDLVAAALGTCMATLMAMIAQQHQLDIQGTQVVVQKRMSNDVPRRISYLEINYFVPIAASHPQCEVLKAAALNCPVSHSLHPDIEQKVTFHWL